MRNSPDSVDSQAHEGDGSFAVLVVDDEEDSLVETRDMLAAIPGLTVAGAFTDPQAAIESLDDRVHVDCAFLDIRMPVINGFELGERLLRRYPSLLIVYVTAHNDCATEAFDTDAVDYVLKPVRKERLRKSVDRLLARRQASGQDTGGAEPTGPGSPVRVQCFGRLELWADDRQVHWPTKKSMELFAYLLHHNGRYVSKEKIVDDLWPDQGYENALVNLHTTVYRIRQALGELREHLSIDYEDGSYRLLMSDVYFDVDEFEGALDQSRLHPERTATLLAQASRVYAGDYLEEQSYIWSVDLQEGLRQRHVECLKGLASQHMADGVTAEAIPLLEAAVLKNPYDSGACDLLFKAYQLAKDAGPMVAFYRKARERLAKGFGKNGLRLVEQRFLESYLAITGKSYE